MYAVHCLVSGFPAKSRTHGGMGWSSVYLLRGQGRNMLVDTGPPAYVQLLHQSLARHGLQPGDITHILVTHLHWDHVSNFTMFENAQVVVSELELDWATKQPPGTQFVPDVHVARLDAMREQVLLVHDGQQLLPGVTAMWTPGHTPGHFAFQVSGDDATLLFAGDAVKNRFELSTADVDSTMDRDASRRSVRELRTRLSVPGAVLVPGHDVELALVGEDVVPLKPQECEVEVFLETDGAPQPRSMV
jgi:N-acyl homoserine lactone hydrolase